MGLLYVLSSGIRVDPSIMSIKSAPFAKWVEFSPMVLVIGVQSQVESYQRLKKMVLDAFLLSTQRYKERIKGNVKQFWEWSGTLLYTSV